ncbi:MAG: OpgC family protein, partial [Paracoccaceae bacterium]
MTSAATNTKTKAPRDPRLDFFRGIAMFIILVAHITNNPWTLWIPARFGFSDATEIFVFCSGMASAIAFGAVFRNAGWMLGTLRILHRMWQVYWAHLGVFFVALLCMVALNRTGWFEIDYVGALNLYPFLNSTGANMIGLMTLTYVPNYFDILPMYLVILGMVPVVMLLSQVHLLLPLAASVTLWSVGTFGGLNFPAEYWFPNGSTREWFFDPFCWQLIFFTGFSFMAGWLPAPPVRRDLAVLAAVIVVVTVPFAWGKSIAMFEFVREWRGNWTFLFDKTHFGILRFVHFLSIAYLAWLAVGPRGIRLANPALETPVRVISRVGQQSLAIFMVSMVLARLLGVVLDVIGRSFVATAFVNFLGFAILIGVAYAVRYIKSEPWRVVRAATPASAGGHLPQGLASAKVPQ